MSKIKKAFIFGSITEAVFLLPFYLFLWLKIGVKAHYSIEESVLRFFFELSAFANSQLWLLTNGIDRLFDAPAFTGAVWFAAPFLNWPIWIFMNPSS